MNYTEAKKYIDSLNVKFTEFNTVKTRKLLKKAGISLKDSFIVHIAGTNGKGSVCAMLEAILLEAGYSTGLYTFPAFN
ncbi:MAG: hypothetical protein ABIA76_03460 [Candidatus Diapherotrites archaeon]